MMDESTAWLLPNWIPRGRPSLLVGLPEAPAATLACWLASCVLRGCPLPDGARIETHDDHRILWVPTVGRIAELTDELKALDAPLDKFFRPVMDDDPSAEFDPTNEAWLELVAAIAREERPAWIVVDRVTLSALMRPSIDRCLEVLVAVAKETGCAATILCERDQEIRATSAVKRWAEITGRMQTVVSISRWAPDSDDLRLRVSKTGSALPDPLRLRIENGVPTIVPTPATQSRTSLDRAVAYLERGLALGTQPAAQVIQVARSDHGFSKRTLDRAKKRLGVKSFHANGCWHWILP